MYCVVGLGNPGREYSGTRHNVGFKVVGRLAGDHETRIRRRAYSALTATIRIGRSKVLLMKPQTYMNASGRSVRAACDSMQIPPDRIIVAYDEVDLPLGRLRVRAGGGAAGHKGLRSIRSELGTGDFVRVRIGVGRPPEGVDTADYVLEKFEAAEAGEISAVVERAARAVACVINKGVDAAMAEFNGPAESAG